MRFRYRAATAEGAEVGGALAAAPPAAALEELRRRALVPIALDADAGSGGTPARWRAGGGAARGPALALFARTLATLLEAGVPLERALAFCEEQAGHPAVAAAVRDVRQAVRGGSALAPAVARYGALFGPLAVAMLGAGEGAGALPAAAARLADHLDEGEELRAQVRAALLYPALMATVAAAGVTVLLLVVVPRFVAMLDETGSALPWSTRVLVGASALLVRGWWAWALLVVAAVAATRAWLADDANRARWHAARLALPLAGDVERRWA
ncbi:type II secretion system F family protein, partial [Roseisolibacter sp. H3M3-2]|uniref:type II secretion system F family protein n=1 Tax=Roseisolibacter sp. H3M3-2 TaxID=3031323 RepID=UPI0023DC4AA6